MFVIKLTEEFESQSSDSYTRSSKSSDLTPGWKTVSRTKILTIRLPSFIRKCALVNASPQKSEIRLLSRVYASNHFLPNVRCTPRGLFLGRMPASVRYKQAIMMIPLYWIWKQVNFVRWIFFLKLFILRYHTPVYKEMKNSIHEDSAWSSYSL